VAPGTSPLKAKPLRLPGQSIQDELDELAWDTVAGYLLVAAMASFLAFMEWMAVLNNWPRQPWVFTGLAAVAISVAVPRIFIAVRRAQHLKLGRDGERVVGQFLDELRAKGAQVFHDVPADGFNLDHVIISARGIFAVETKTFSKPRVGKPTISFDEAGGIRVAGRTPDRDAIAQAQSAASWLRMLLRESTGKEFSVRSVVLFPGWFVEPMSRDWKRDQNKPWVLEPKGLPAFIEHEPGTIGPSDVTLAAYHLSRYVRAEQERLSRS
jgi:hypothetical protein